MSPVATVKDVIIARGASATVGAGDIGTAPALMLQTFGSAP